jgi:4-amino-4-deoxy-L-arabinose transferase-like glycosyltransferase
MVRVLSSRVVHYLLLLTVTAALTLPGLGALSLWDIDEGLNAEAAREMFESGDWVVPTFNFKPRTAKPAMLYWLQALAYQRFGVGEFAARLPSALAGAVAVLLTYQFGRRMFGAAVGLLAGVILASTVQVGVLTHAATPDALLLACMTLTIWLFWTGSENGSRRWTWATGLGCGLAVLAKGPVGVVMPAAIGGYFFLAQRQGRRLLDPRLLGGVLLIVLGAIALWGVWAGRVYGHTHRHGHEAQPHWHLHIGRRDRHPVAGAHSHVPTLIGAAFAVSSLRALTLLAPFGDRIGGAPLATLLVLICVFAAGILLSMSLFGVAFASLMTSGVVARLGRAAGALMAVASITLGFYWILHR